MGKRRMKVAVAGYKELAPGIFDVWGYVTSESREGVVYHVRVTIRHMRMFKWTCECEDFLYRGVAPCKHAKLLAVAFTNAYKRGKLDEALQRGAKWAERRLGIPARPGTLGSKAPSTGPIPAAWAGPPHGPAGRTSSRAEPGQDQRRRASEPAYA